MSHRAECIEKTDADLVRLTLEDQTYFACIIERYEKKLMRYVLRITKIDPEDAQDVLQDVFIKVYTNLRSFDDGLKFSSWIYRITRNHVISLHRRAKARPQAVYDPDELLLNSLASSFDIQDELDNDLLRERFNAVLNKIDRKYREVIVLQYFEEKSYREMSDILQKPEGTIATLVNRAKKQVKKIYEKTY
jgi:RNA polymerase sigma-70 factor (ECF subfamily)